MDHPRHILVGVAWPYANGEQHIGHIAGAYLPPDIFARFQRMRGNHVLMVSGTRTAPLLLSEPRQRVSARLKSLIGFMPPLLTATSSSV